MFGFLLVAPLIVAGMAYLAIVSAKPFREWVDARVAERDKASGETGSPKELASGIPEIVDLGARGSAPQSNEPEAGGVPSARPADGTLAAFAVTPSADADEFRGLVTRLPGADDGFIAISFREETGTTEIALRLPADAGQAEAVRGMEPGQSRQATLRLRWTQGEDPHIVLDEWIRWGYQGSHEETN